MNTFQLSCFLAVAESLSFARAAERLNITQPAVSHQIRALEDELNTKLFRRSTRSVELTQSGALFLGDAQELLAISVRAKHRFERSDQQMIQVFSIGSHGYVQLQACPEVLRRLVEQYPSLHPRMLIEPFPHLNRLLAEEKVDVILGLREPKERKEQKQPGIYQELMKVDVCCVCARDHPLAQRSTVRMEDLKKEKLIAVPPMRCPSQIAALQYPLVNGAAPSDVYLCDSIEISLLYAQAGLGVTVFPNFFLPMNHSLVSIPIENTEPLSFGLCYKTLKGNEPLKAFVKLMQSHYYG